MSHIFSLNSGYSTTRRVTRTRPDVFNSLEKKFECRMFLPQHPQRKDSGGLRHQGYFKTGRCLGLGGFEGEPQSLITVINVVFNGAATLEQSILSVINQSYDNIEFIIIDGGSTDGTVDIIRKYEHAIDYWVSEPDTGIYDAFNKAVMCASGDWLCFLGVDDYLWDKDVLCRMVPSMEAARPVCKLVYGSVAVVNGQQDVILRVGESWEIAKRKLRGIMSIPHQGLMHHRTWFEDYGLFDAAYRIVGDYEILLRGWPAEDALFIPDCIVAGMAQGGISSSPENCLTALTEIRHAQEEHGMSVPSIRLLAAFLATYVKLVLLKLFGERRAYQLIDVGRKLLGRTPYWTRI